jgi:hypothetical protein
MERALLRLTDLAGHVQDLYDCVVHALQHRQIHLQRLLLPARTSAASGTRAPAPCAPRLPSTKTTANMSSHWHAALIFPDQ